MLRGQKKVRWPRQCPAPGEVERLPPAPAAACRSGAPGSPGARPAPTCSRAPRPDRLPDPLLYIPRLPGGTATRRRADTAAAARRGPCGDTGRAGTAPREAGAGEGTALSPRPKALGRGRERSGPRPLRRTAPSRPSGSAGVPGELERRPLPVPHPALTVWPRRPRFVPVRSRRRPHRCLSRRGSAETPVPSPPGRAGAADARRGTAPPGTAPPRGRGQGAGAGPAGAQRQHRPSRAGTGRGAASSSPPSAPRWVPRAVAGAVGGRRRLPRTGGTGASPCLVPWGQLGRAPGAATRLPGGGGGERGRGTEGGNEGGWSLARSLLAGLPPLAVCGKSYPEQLAAARPHRRRSRGARSPRRPAQGDSSCWAGLCGAGDPPWASPGGAAAAPGASGGRGEAAWFPLRGSGAAVLARAGKETGLPGHVHRCPRVQLCSLGLFQHAGGEVMGMVSPAPGDAGLTVGLADLGGLFQTTRFVIGLLN